MASGLPTAFRHIKDNQKPLRFNSNGKFRILHLTDIHEVDPAMDDDEDPEIPKRKSEETISKRGQKEPTARSKRTEGIIKFPTTFFRPEGSMRHRVRLTNAETNSKAGSERAISPRHFSVTTT